MFKNKLYSGKFSQNKNTITDLLYSRDSSHKSSFPFIKEEKIIFESSGLLNNLKLQNTFDGF